MSERIRSLLGRVAASEGSSSEIDRDLRERLPSTGSISALEREIASEIASSLGRAGSKLELAIERALAARVALESASPGSAEQRVLLERYATERGEAERRLRDLMIQREAIGLRRHTDLRERYVIPAPWSSEPGGAGVSDSVQATSGGAAARARPGAGDR
jgi:hypothetical protein